MPKGCQQGESLTGTLSEVNTCSLFVCLSVCLCMCDSSSAGKCNDHCSSLVTCWRHVLSSVSQICYMQSQQPAPAPCTTQTMLNRQINGWDASLSREWYHLEMGKRTSSVFDYSLGYFRHTVMWNTVYHRMDNRLLGTRRNSTLHTNQHSAQ